MAPTDPDGPSRPDGELGDTRVRPPGEGSEGETGSFQGPNETRVREGQAPGPGAAPVFVPGFVVRGVLGRGGMGVVYRATQDGLNREVALKMLLAGPFAHPALRARFLLEAEAVAALEHPHIIRVHAFGETGGHPYLAMELAPGGTLSERLKASGPLPPPEAAAVLAQLAGAVAHAHSRGVVHRDIKPLNVLFGADGELRLTDFGLAKVGRVDHQLSLTGQVLGTPAYMAPEQAAGKVREVGTAADIYALGAVLYDLLTGRPPFRGDSVAVTLQKVLTEEPERPRRHNPAVPRDLETVCLKCLAKDPGGRYPTAQALADDLLRYVRGEPVTAHPAGALERAWKWVRRNKVVAGAAAAVALALVTGAALSVGFGLKAADRQKQAEDAAERAAGEAARADRERDAAFAARNDLAHKNGELVEARRRTDRNLARALFGPLRAEKSRPLTAEERESFRSLAGLGPSEVPLMFLEEATRSPASATRLAVRSEFAWQAVVGLDPERRSAVVRFVEAHLCAPGATDERRARFALAVVRWEDATDGLWVCATRVLTEALATEPDADARRSLAEGLAAGAERLPLEEATRTLSSALAKETDRDVQQLLADGLAAAVRGRSPEQARMVLAEPARLLGRATDEGTRWVLAETIVLVAAHLSPEQARVALAEPARALAEACAKKAEVWDRQALAVGLAKVAQQLTDGQARALAGSTGVLTDALAVETNAWNRRALAEGLAAVAAGLPPEQAARALAAPAQVLAGALTRETNDWNRRHLAKGLTAIIKRLPQEQAERVLATQVQALSGTAAKKPNDSSRLGLAEGLAAIAQGVPPEQAANQLSAALAKETEVEPRWALTKGLVAVSEQMLPEPAARTLADALTGANDARTRLQLVQGLAAAAKRLPPERAAAVLTDTARLLTRALAEDTDLTTRHLLVLGLAAVAEGLPNEHAAAALAEPVRAVKGALSKVTVAQTQRGQVDTLRSVARALLPTQAEVLAAEHFRTLSDALVKETGIDVRLDMSRALAAVARRLPPEQAAKILDDALAEAADWLSQRALAEGLAAVTQGLPPERAARTLTGPARVLTDALARETDDSARRALAEGLAAVARRLPPEQAATVLAGPAATLAEALDRETKPDARRALAEGLAALAAGLPPEQAARVLAAPVRSVADALAKSTDVEARRVLVDGLAALAGALPPQQAAAALAAALEWETDPRHRTVLAQVMAHAALGVRHEQPERSLRIAVHAVGHFGPPLGALPSLPALHPETNPSPRPLAPQQLVELLKQPFCFGEARRAVLNALGATYRTTFTDLWEFVAYARQHQPHLDLVSQPTWALP